MLILQHYGVIWTKYIHTKKIFQKSNVPRGILACFIDKIKCLFVNITTLWCDLIKLNTHLKIILKKYHFWTVPRGIQPFFEVYLDKFWEFDPFFDDSDMLNSWFFDQKWHKINIKLACPQGGYRRLYSMKKFIKWINFAKCMNKKR